MALDLIAELEALIDAFAREGIEYAVCGGLSLAIHGHPRATMDIDLLVPSAMVPRAAEVARQLGFDIPARMITFGLRTGNPRTVQRVSKLDPQTNELVSLDLMHADPAFEDVWAGRVVVMIGERKMVVVSRDGLATMKRLAGRPQDLADLAILEGTADDEQA
jgi:hypothetical protein